MAWWSMPETETPLEGNPMYYRFIGPVLLLCVLLGALGCDTPDKTTPNLPDKDNPPPPPGGMKGKGYPSSASRP